MQKNINRSEIFRKCFNFSDVLGARNKNSEGFWCDDNNNELNLEKEQILGSESEKK